MVVLTMLQVPLMPTLQVAMLNQAESQKFVLTKSLLTKIQLLLQNASCWMKLHVLVLKTQVAVNGQINVLLS